MNLKGGGWKINNQNFFEALNDEEKCEKIIYKSTKYRIELFAWNEIKLKLSRSLRSIPAFDLFSYRSEGVERKIRNKRQH